MTKQRNRPGVGVYFALILLLLCGYYLFFDTLRVPAVSYAQAEDLFRREQVQSFYVKNGSELYLSLRDGTTVRNELGSTDRFREELGELIREQKAAGILVDYDFAPVYRPPWWSEILLYVLLIGGIFLVWQYMMIRAQGGGGSMDQGKRFGKARIRFGSDSQERVDFEQVAGAREEKEELQEIVGFLKEPRKYLDLGARIPKGVLLVGPPGTGKTLLAKAVAGEAGVQFLSISGSDFVELYVGVGASRVRDLFEEAKKVAPSVVFIDEIDAVGRRRGAGLGGGHDEREQTLNQLLVEMDGFGSNSGVVVLAATNRADILDPALLRPGRFDRQVYVGRPDSRGREEILAVHTRNKPLAEDVDLKVLAQSTSGFTGADLENLVNEGALLSARKGQKFITMDNLQEAVIKVIAGPEKRSRVVPEHELSRGGPRRHAPLPAQRGPRPRGDHHPPGTGGGHDHLPAGRGPGLLLQALYGGGDRGPAGRPGGGEPFPGRYLHRRVQRHPAGLRDRPEDGHGLRHERTSGLRQLRLGQRRGVYRPQHGPGQDLF